MTCKHCGRRIERGPLRRALPWVHLTDLGVAGPQRCNPEESGQPAGLEAEPTTEERK
ncbi:hypothetical protein SEA_RUCHI_58 [Arthrobacter phage Ruchi]|nr:hypothetical protein SEA_BASILISK_59 [Arthrobacter phage Basilisk]WNM69505.1 hypothetical protein SEA_RUCHI_58 [Arthrobacter phage Ruchi]